MYKPTYTAVMMGKSCCGDRIYLCMYIYSDVSYLMHLRLDNLL